MTISTSDSLLPLVVSSWREKFISVLEDHSNCTKLLANKDLSMYQAIGCVTDIELARQMVSDYAVQQAEQTLGHLYELILEEAGSHLGQTLGLEKVEDKKTDGRLGLDFIQLVNRERRLIEVSAKPNSKSGSGRKGRVQNMKDNEEFWAKQRNDNPLSPTRKTVMVWAAHRGRSKHETNKDGILEVVGDSMWSYIGLGESFTRELSRELSKQQIPPAELHSLKQSMETIIREHLKENGYSDRITGHIDYNSLIADHP